jgi:hypothetical protein
LAVSWATQRTYWPWFFHGITPPAPSDWPSHGHAAAIAACAVATAVGSHAEGFAIEAAGDEKTAAAATALRRAIDRANVMLSPSVGLLPFHHRAPAALALSATGLSRVSVLQKKG